ncbi:hypothetical protein ACA910_017295 [Epithemia clementina (nom. ined.)]
MADLRDLSLQIKKMSKENQGDTGRLGLTVADVTSMIQIYFTKRAQEFVMANLNKILSMSAEDQSKLFRTGTAHILDKASNAILDYAVDATAKYAQGVEPKWRESSWRNSIHSLFNAVNKTIEQILK